MSIKVNLNNIERVKKFVDVTTKFDSDKVDLDLVSGRYVIDARSIMGIFSLDLSKPIELVVGTEDVELAKKVEDALVEFKA
jgi:phosphotransferase system HPr-like phosphotransfer protein